MAPPPLPDQTINRGRQVAPTIGEKEGPPTPVIHDPGSPGHPALRPSMVMPPSPVDGVVSQGGDADSKVLWMVVWEVGRCSLPTPVNGLVG